MSVPLNVARAGLAALLLATTLALVTGARAAHDPLPLNLGQIIVADGRAIVTGVVDDADAILEVNGAPVDLDATGAFQTVADLDAHAVVLTLASAPGETITIEIPIDVLLASEGQGILDDLVDAGVAIDVPIDGFRVVDGQMPVLSGTVVNAERLSLLRIGGVNVLSRIRRGGDFQVAVPASSDGQEHVTVVAADQRGVSQTTTFPLANVSSVIRTRTGASVSAAGARGLVISKVRFDTRALRSGSRLGIAVTVEDRRRFLVRGAALRLAAAPGYLTANGATRVGFTNRAGRASFTYRLSARALAATEQRWLRIVARASTPSTTATRTTAVRLPLLMPR
jgi:hypothetical protein